MKEPRGAADERRVAGVLSRCYPQEAWTAHDVVRFADRGGNVVKTLALDDGRVAGALLYRVRPDGVQIARVAVEGPLRRCRAGAYALRYLTGPTSPVRRTVYEIRLHECNVEGLAFARRCGFDGAGVAREHFRDGKDAYIMRLFKEAPHHSRRTALAA